jgi:lipopolysaccharide export system permease protein
MRLLDRYVLKSFLYNYLISFAVLIGMYIVLDMVFKLDDIVEVRNQVAQTGIGSAVAVIRDLADFYFYQAFPFFINLSPVIPVAATAFTLVRLTRTNELVAMLAAGVPLLRIAMPIVLSCVVLTGLVAVVQEMVVPNIIPKLTREASDMGRETGKSFQVNSLQDGQGNILRVSRFIPGSSLNPPTMIEMDVIFRNAKRQPTYHLKADRALWEAEGGRWKLIGGKVTRGLLPDETRTAEAPAAYYQSTITPDEISLYRSRSYVDLLSTARINQLLASPEGYGINDLLRVKHFRFTQYVFNNWLIVLLAIPCVMTREPTQLKRGVLKCMCFTGSFLGTVFMAQQLAGHPPEWFGWPQHWPALLAWMPTVIYFPMAMVMLGRMKT